MNLCHLNKLFFALLFIGGGALAAEGELFQSGFETDTGEWVFKNAPLASPGYQSSACVVLGRTERSLIASPRIPISPEKTYELSCYLKGRGRLWLHAWCFDADGNLVKGLLVPDFAGGTGREVDIDSEAWILSGMRGMKFSREVATIQICFEYRDEEIPGVREVSVDAVCLRESDEALPDFSISLSRSSLRSGEWLTAVAQLPPAIGDRSYSCEWSYLGKDGKPHPYGWPERNKGTRFETSPRFPGEYILRATLTDNLGSLEVYKELPVQVTANQPPTARIQYRLLDDGQVELDASASVDPDGDEITRYRWELPDGSVSEQSKLVYNATQFNAFTVWLSVFDRAGLEGQREMEIARILPPPTVEPTVADTLRVTATADGVRGESAEIALRLGHMEYLAVKVENHATETLTFVIRPVVAENDKGNTVIQPIAIQLPAKSAASFALPVQTWLNQAHSARVEVASAVGNCEIPLNIRVVEQYPIFGTQEHFHRPLPGRIQAEADLPALEELPCQLYRLPDVLTWVIQQQNGAEYNYRFSVADWYVDALLKRGKTPVHTFLGYVPKELMPLDENFPEKAVRYQAYVKAVLEHYKGRVFYWEPFNEPPWHGMKDYQKNGGEVLLAMTRILYEEVQKISPDAKIVAPGYCRNADFKVIEDFLQAGGDRYVDVYNFHQYTAHYHLARRHLTSAFDRYVEQGEVMRHLKQLHDHKIDKPLFVSECGGNVAQVNSEASRLKSIQFLRTCLIWLAAGVKGIQQYELFDYPHEPLPSLFNLMRYSDHYKFPMFFTFREMIKSFTGAETLGEAVTLENSAIRMAHFRRGNETIVALWNCENSPAEVNITFPAQQVAWVQEKKFSYSDDVFLTSSRRAIEDHQQQIRHALGGYQVTIFSFSSKTAKPEEVTVTASRRP